MKIPIALLALFLVLANLGFAISCVNLTNNATFPGGMTGSMGTGFTVNGSIRICPATYAFSGVTALTVAGPNATIDCMGATLSGDNTSGTSGILTDQLNTTIEDCNVSGFATGINFDGASNGTITGSTATADQTGIAIYLDSGSGNSVVDSTGIASIGTGINLYSSSYNRIINFTGVSDSNKGIDLYSGSSYNAIIGSSGTSNSDNGIFVSTDSDYNNISNCTGTSGSGNGIYIEWSSNDTIAGSSGTSDSGGEGIHFSGSNDSIIGSNGTSDSGFGIHLVSSANGMVIGSTGASNSGQGILLESSSNDQVIGSSGTASGNVGIHLYNAENETIVNSTGASVSFAGVYFNAGSTDNTVIGSNLTCNYSSAVFYYGVANNTVSDSLIIGMYSSGALEMEGGSEGNTVANSTIDGMGETAVYLDDSESGNVFINNTLQDASPMAQAYGSSNIFCWNNFTQTSGYYVEDGGSDYFNSSLCDGEGNIWANVIDGQVGINGTVPSSGFPDLFIGNSTYDNGDSLGKVTGMSDYASLTANAVYSAPTINLSQGDIPASLGVEGATYLMQGNLTGDDTPITITADGVTLDCRGNAIIFAQTSNGDGIDVEANSATIENCIITNDGTGYGQTGISLSSYEGSIVRNNTISVTRNGGDWSWGQGITSSGSNDTIEDNNVSAASIEGSMWTTGLNLGDSNDTVVNNTIYSPPNSGVECVGILIQAESGSTISDNNITDPGCWPGDDWGIGFFWSPSGNNELYGNSVNSALDLYVYGTGNTILHNNLTGTEWVDDSSGGNYYNDSSSGNIYYETDGTPSWDVYNISDINSDDWADVGTDLPFSSSLSGGEWQESGQDWHPYTLTQGPPYGISQLSISPASPQPTDNLSCNLLIYDADAPSANVTYGWYKDGQNMAGLGGNYTGFPVGTETAVSTLASGNLTIGDSWQCGVNVKFDSENSSGWANSTPVQVSPCGIDITEAGTNYSLEADANSTGGDCIDVDADNVTIDCHGHSIIGSGSGIGVYSNSVSGTTVDNCNISNFADDIYFNGVTSGAITDSELSFSQYDGSWPEGLGAYLYATTEVNISGNSIHDNPDYALYLDQGSDNNEITYNNMSNNDEGMYLYYANNNQVDHNTLLNSYVAYGSCPFLYLWNGSEYGYYTDLGGEPLGVPWFRPQKYEAGVYGLGNFQPVDGVYKLKVREVIPESDYFDEAKLALVDVPQGYGVLNTWSYTYPFNQAPTEQFMTIKDPKAPISATDNYGYDVLPEVSFKDGAPVKIYDNVQNPVTLDFGNITNPQYAKLVITGWAAYNLNPALKPQNYLMVQTPDGKGGWTTRGSFGGFIGDSRTIVFNMSGILESNDTRMRIIAPSSSSTIHLLDQVLLDDSAPVDFNVTYVEPSSANLQPGGSTNYVYATIDHRHVNVTDNHNPSIPDDMMYGNFTKYGDVLPLLASADDEFVVMRHGDELQLQFNDTPRTDGSDRYAFLVADDMYTIKNSINGFVRDSIDPMPFHGMSQYPYNASQGYPDQAARQAYEAEWNTRVFAEPSLNSTEVSLPDSYNNTLSENTIIGGYGSSMGLSLDVENDTKLLYNNISGVETGIVSYYSVETQIIGNIINATNGGTGIYLDEENDGYDTNTTVSDNSILSDDIGIQLDYYTVNTLSGFAFRDLHAVEIVGKQALFEEVLQLQETAGDLVLAELLILGHQLAGGGFGLGLEFRPIWGAERVWAGTRRRGTAKTFLEYSVMGQ